MSESIFETFTDERGNISVRVSQEVQVLTREEADRIEAEYKRMQAENAKLRELAVLNWEWAHSCCGNNCKMKTNDCGYQIDRDCNYEREIWDRMRELGVEVD